MESVLLATLGDYNDFNGKKWKQILLLSCGLIRSTKIVGKEGRDAGASFEFSVLSFEHVGRSHSLAMLFGQ